MVVVTHEMAFAREAADRVYLLEEGQFVEAGPPEQVLDAPRDERTRTFLARFTAHGDARASAEASAGAVPSPESLD
jgi:ABC-type glutathione transport system ATPase component